MYIVFAVGALWGVCAFDTKQGGVEWDVARSQLCEEAHLVAA